ncbi:MAG: hypothetical protein WCF94_03185 [bacterium]
MLKFESGDKNVHDIIEGPPRMEELKAEKFIGHDNSQENSMSQNISAKILVTKDNAHGIALSLLKNSDFINKLKEVISERIIKNQTVTRLDQVIEENVNNNDYRIYGLTKDHIADIEKGDFLNFDLVSDGPDFAITFNKFTGDKGIRPIDDQALAEMINRIFSMHPQFSTAIQDKIKLN